MKLSAILSYLALSLLLVGCGSAESGASSADSAGNESVQAEASLRDAQGDSMSVNLVQNRDIVRKGSLTVRVEKVEETEKSVSQVLRNLGGYVENSSSYGLESATPQLSMTMRVPVKNFDPLIEQLSEMGTVMNKSLSAEDVTKQIVDFDARLKTLKAQEESYQKMISQAKNVTESSALLNEVTKVRTTIEQIEASKKELKNQANFSTLDLTLTQDSLTQVGATDSNWANEEWGMATRSFGGFIRGISSMLIWLAVFSPFWGGAIGGVWWLSRKHKKNAEKWRAKNAKKNQAPPQQPQV